MTEAELKNRIKENKNGFYIFYGENEFLKDYYATVLKKEVKDDSFNYSHFEGEDFTFYDIEGFLTTYSFGEERKMIEVIDPKITKWSDSELSAFADLLNEGFDNMTVLFVYRKDAFESKLIPPAKAPAKPTAIYNLGISMKSNCFFVDFPTSDVNKLINWIARHFQKSGVEISSDVPKHLIDFCGNDMYTLKGEIEKLCAVCKNVTKAEIEKYCCSNVEYQTFDLSEAIATCNVSKVRAIFLNLKLKKADPLMIMGTLIKSFYDMLLCKEAKKEGISASKLAKDFAMNSWVAEKRMKSSQNVSKEYVEFAINECSECDKKLKSFSSNQYIHIELLLEKLLAATKK